MNLFVIATGNPGKIMDFADSLGTENKAFKTLKEIGFSDEIVEGTLEGGDVPGNQQDGDL